MRSYISGLHIVRRWAPSWNSSLHILCHSERYLPRLAVCIACVPLRAKRPTRIKCTAGLGAARGVRRSKDGVAVLRRRARAGGRGVVKPFGFHRAQGKSGARQGGSRSTGERSGRRAGDEMRRWAWDGRGTQRRGARGCGKSSVREGCQFKQLGAWGGRLREAAIGPAARAAT